MKPKRLLIMSDMHCGHDVGLTPPGWDADRPREPSADDYYMRRAVWDWFDSEVLPHKWDAVIMNGDAIDGKGGKSGSTEQLYPDRTDQVEMASDILRMLKTKHVLMSYGTPYHTGDLEDWEDVIAREIGAEKIGGEDNLEINNNVINYRHHIGRSSVPHGRHTAIAKEVLWNLLWSERGEYPKANILVRSHVHYHAYAGSFEWLAMTTPALQGYGTKYGTRRVSGLVDIGVVIFEFDKYGGYTWQPLRLVLPLKAPLSIG